MFVCMTVLVATLELVVAAGEEAMVATEELPVAAVPVATVATAVMQAVNGRPVIVLPEAVAGEEAMAAEVTLPGNGGSAGAGANGGCVGLFYANKRTSDV